MIVVLIKSQEERFYIFFNQNTSPRSATLPPLTKIYKDTAHGIVCIREESTRRSFTSGDNFVNVPAFQEG